MVSSGRDLYGSAASPQVDVPLHPPPATPHINHHHHHQHQHNIAAHKDATTERPRLAPRLQINCENCKKYQNTRIPCYYCTQVTNQFVPERYTRYGTW